jgi:hypothetical protein
MIFTIDKTAIATDGFSAKKDLLAQLLALNQQVAAKIEKGEPVTAPGVPKNYPDAKKLVTGRLYPAVRHHDDVLWFRYVYAKEPTINCK